MTILQSGEHSIAVLTLKSREGRFNKLKKKNDKKITFPIIISDFVSKCLCATRSWNTEYSAQGWLEYCGFQTFWWLKSSLWSCRRCGG